MKFRIAKKAVSKWARGEGNYTDNHFGTILRAERKLLSYYARHKVDTSKLQFRGLPYCGMPSTGRITTL